LHVLEGPRLRAVRDRHAREDLDAPLDFDAGEFLAESRHVDALALADWRLRVEDHDAELRTRGEVARVPRLRRGDPVELRVPRWRVVDGRHPRPPARVGGPEHQVSVAVDDRPCDAVEVVAHRAPERAQLARNSTTTGVRTVGSVSWVWPSSVDRRAFGRTSASACAAVRHGGGPAPPSITSVGTVTVDHRSLDSGLPAMLSPRIRTSYGIVCAIATSEGQNGDPLIDGMASAGPRTPTVMKYST